MGSRTVGFLRREMQWSSVSKNLTICSITYIKPTQTASGFEIELKDGHGSSVLLELQELPITQENIKTLFDVWDYHVYSPSFYLNWKTQKIKKLIQRMCALYFYGCHVIKQIKDRIIQSLIIWFFTHNGNKTHRNIECCTWRRRCIKFFFILTFFFNDSF